MLLAIFYCTCSCRDVPEQQGEQQAAESIALLEELDQPAHMDFGSLAASGGREENVEITEKGKEREKKNKEKKEKKHKKHKKHHKKEKEKDKKHHKKEKGEHALSQ